LIHHGFKKYPLNLRVKLRFFKSRAKPISYPLLSALDSRIQVLQNNNETIKMKIAEALKQRKSVRSYLDKAVEEEKIESSFRGGDKGKADYPYYPTAWAEPRRQCGLLMLKC